MNDVEEYMFKKPYEIMTLQDVYIELIIAELQEDRKKWVNQYTQAHNDYVSLQQKTKQLQNNWNELKKWLEEETEENDTTIKKCDQVIFKMGNENRKDTHQHKLIDVCSRENLVFNRMLSKMQELEGKNE